MLPVAILAGGFATRLWPLAKTLPKALIEICGRPFIDWQMKLLAQNEIERVVICVAHKAEMIQAFVGDGRRYGIQVDYSKDGPTQLGTGGAIRNALPSLGNEFMVLYGDSYLPIAYRDVEAAFHRARKPALMTVYRNDGAYDASNVVFSYGQLQKYSKGGQDPAMTHIDYGLSAFDSSLFERYPLGSYIDLSDICANLSATESLAGYEIHERFYEIGSHRGIKDFSQYIERNHNVV